MAHQQGKHPQQPDRAPMPASQARDLAQAEAARWQTIADMAATVARYEDEAGDLSRRHDKLREDREKAETDAATAIADATQRKLRALEEADKAILAAAKERDDFIAVTRDEIAARQKELIQIERDRDGAKAKAIAEVAALKQELVDVGARVQAMRADEAALLAKYKAA
jgi:predicted  nucleic acid-binding Zn-ribbon protein